MCTQNKKCLWHKNDDDDEDDDHSWYLLEMIRFKSN